MKKWIFWVLMLLFAAVFCVSAWYLADYFIESHKQGSQYDELSQLVEQARQDTPPASTGDGETRPTDSGDLSFLPGMESHTAVTHPETGETVTVLREYAAIFLKNPDLVGWIRVEGTELDYPVMQTPDSPDYYLTRNFYREPSAHGCIYVSEACDVNAPSDNLLLHGHNMKDGSMFAPLHKYQDADFWREHPTFTFDTLTEHRTYEILSVFLTTATVEKGFPYYKFINAEDETAFDVFVGRCKDLSLYHTGVDASYGDKLITLSTCEYSQENGRLVVVAKQIS